MTESYSSDSAASDREERRDGIGLGSLSAGVLASLLDHPEARAEFFQREAREARSRLVRRPRTPGGWTALSPPPRGNRKEPSFPDSHALDVPSRLRSSFRLHPVAWVAGAVGVGVLVATLFRRGGNGSGTSQWRPLLLGTLGFLGNRALTLSLPALGGLLEAELNRWLFRRRPAADETPHEARVSL